MRTARGIASIAVLCLLLVPACRGGQRKQESRSVSPPPVPEIHRGTVGAYVRFRNLRAMQVMGYGLVIGLKGTGSKGMPGSVRHYLMRQMYRSGISDAEAAKILESPNTAACLVRGTVLPFHTKGSRFDVEVVALPTTQTKSLEGGVLVKTSLAPMIRDVRGRPVLAAPVAYAHGPVLIQPLAPGRPVDPRRGVIIGGGRFNGSRSLTLELLEPNYRMCLLLEQVINNRFPHCAKAGSRRVISPKAFLPEPEGGSPSLEAEPPPREMQYFIRLNVPPEYRGRWLHFAQVVAALYIDGRPQAVANRLGYLLAKLRDPKERAAACFGLEALGQPSVGPLVRLLSDPDRDVRISAAMVLNALGDERGVDVLVKAAEDPDCPQRMSAIAALGRVHNLRALRVLERLCASPDIPLRLAAYEALRRMPEQTVVEHFDRISLQDRDYEIRRFGIDLVHCAGPPLIVANAANDPRLIFFGEDIRLKPPFFFDEGRYWAIAPEGATAITIRPPEPPPRRPLIGKPFTIPLKVLHYVVVMDALGASYPQVLERLRKADELGRIVGKFVVRRPAMVVIPSTIGTSPPSSVPPTGSGPTARPGRSQPTP